jgi:hypothetical protein
MMGRRRTTTTLPGSLLQRPLRHPQQRLLPPRHPQRPTPRLLRIRSPRPRSCHP